MNKKPLRPTIRFAVSGLLCLALAGLMGLAFRDLRWCIAQGGIAGATLMLLIPVLIRGDSWQKVLAGAMLFFPAFNLVMATIGAAASRL
jgi:hypothetical protein